MERETESGFRLQGLALVHSTMGQRAKAQVALEQLIKDYANEAAFQIAEVYAFWGDADKAFEWLERSYAQRDPGLVDMKVDPLLKNLKRDPRYTAFLKKMRRTVD